jgi:hypothetical protein
MLDGDLVDQLLSRVLGRRLHRNPGAIIAGAVALLWAPPFLLSMLDRTIAPAAPTGFLIDYGAYAQFLVGAPLLLIARLILDREFTLARSSVLDSSFLGHEEMLAFGEASARARSFLRSKSIDRCVVALGLAMSMAWFIGEMTNGVRTYHSLFVGSGFVEVPSLAGTYIAFISIPAYTITLVYWASRYAGWVYLLGSLVLSSHNSKPFIRIDARDWVSCPDRLRPWVGNFWGRSGNSLDHFVQDQR